MTLGKSPASHQAGRRGRVLHHDGGRVEAHGDAHVEGDQASDGEQDEAAADGPDRGRRIDRPTGEGQQDQEERDEHERKEEEGEQEVCPEDAEEPIQAPTEGALQGDGFSAEPPYRVLGHAATYDATEDRAREDRDDGEEQEVAEG